MDCMSTGELWQLAESIWSDISPKSHLDGSFFRFTPFGSFSVLSDKGTLLSFIQFLLTNRVVLSDISKLCLTDHDIPAVLKLFSLGDISGAVRLKDSISELSIAEEGLQKKLARTRKVGQLKLGPVFENCCKLEFEIGKAEKAKVKLQNEIKARNLCQDENLRKEYFAKRLHCFEQIHGSAYISEAELEALQVSPESCGDLAGLQRGLEMHAVNVRKEEILKSMVQCRIGPDLSARMGPKLLQLAQLRRACTEKWQSEASRRMFRLMEILTSRYETVFRPSVFCSEII